MPVPRNDKVASVMMASARLMVAMTSTGPMTFGRMCRTMITGAGRPISAGGRDVILALLHHHGAAHGARILHPEAQADRDTTSTDSVVRRRAALPSTAFTTPSTSSAIRIAGKVSCTSATRMMTASTTPPT